MPSAESSALVFNGVANQFYQTRYPRREDCLSHECYDPILASPLSRTHTAKELFAFAKEKWGAADWALELDRDLLLDLVCEPCDQRLTVGRPLASVKMSEAECPDCGQTMRPETTCRIEQESPLLERTLSELTIPPFDIVKVTATEQCHFVLLGGDEQYFQQPENNECGSG